MEKDIKLDDYVLELKNKVSDAKELVDGALKVYNDVAENFEGEYLGGATDNLKDYHKKLNKYVKEISDFYQVAASYMQYSYDEMKSKDSEISNKIGGE